MRTLYLFVFFHLILTTCYSQSTYLPLVEENKYWIMKTFNDHEPAPQAVGGFLYAFEGDTILNEVKYKKLFKYNLAGTHPCQFPPCFEFEFPYRTLDKTLFGFIREDTSTKKVYYFPYKKNISGSNICNSNECLIYDFSLNKGDTLNNYLVDITIGTDTILKNTVDSIFYGFSGEDQLKTNRRIMSYYGKYPFSQCNIYEGLGYYESGLFVKSLIGDLLYSYCEGSLTECNIITSNYNLDVENSIKVYPNPTNEFININFLNPIANIEILELDGRKTEIRTNSPLNISVSRLVSGPKVIKLVDKKGKVYIGKFLKM